MACSHQEENVFQCSLTGISIRVSGEKICAVSVRPVVRNVAESESLCTKDGRENVERT